MRRIVAGDPDHAAADLGRPGDARLVLDCRSVEDQLVVRPLLRLF